MRYIAILALIFVTTPATTHNAPLGWAYGIECCSFMDCWQEQNGAIHETAAGYEVALTGETIPYNDKRVRLSKDQYFHRCAAAGNPTIRRSICLYVPSKGM